MAVSVPVAAGVAAEEDAAPDPYPAPDEVDAAAEVDGAAAEVDGAAAGVDGAAAGVLLPQALRPTAVAARAVAITVVRKASTGGLLEGWGLLTTPSGPRAGTGRIK